MAERTETFVRRAARAVVGILTLMGGPLTLGADPPQWQSPESIREVVRAFVLQTLPDAGSVTVEAIAVDSRLKLPACSAPLVAQTQGALRNGRGTVAVSCAGAEPWRLFVPVEAHFPVQVLATSRTVQAGQVLAAGDVEVRAASSAALPYEYLSAPAQAVGLTARRTIPAGTVLVPRALERPQLIARGALVTLISGNGPVVVKTEGVALEPAGLHQRLRVRAPSGRVVEGVAESATEVRVGS